MPCLLDDAGHDDSPLAPLLQEDGQEAEDGSQPSDAPRKRQHVQLPWMKVPAAYAPSEEVQIADVAGMKSSLRAALSATGYSTFFPVQAVAWELLGGGLSSKHDLCVNAPTGSGKTLAYVLPLLQRCLKRPRLRGMRGLIVVPTRVLAAQVRPRDTCVTGSATAIASDKPAHEQYSADHCAAPHSARTKSVSGSLGAQQLLSQKSALLLGV